MRSREQAGVREPGGAQDGEDRGEAKNTDRTQMSQSSFKVLGGSVHTDNLPPMVQVTEESDNETLCLISKTG